MRISLATTGVLALLLAGCGAREEQSQGTSPEAAPSVTTSSDSAESNMSINTEERGPAAPRGSFDPLEPTPISKEGGAPIPPDVAPDSAPDVAFGYRYSFGLAADRIASVQQRHARLCEELGPERCKVTGMNYRQRGENDVEAELRLAVEPGVAHRFGERALDSVREAEGRLVESQVTGTDVGTGIRTSTRTLAQLEEQLAELEEQIARGGRLGTLRDLRAEADAVRQQIQSLRNERSDKRELLASTPMSFSYTSRYPGPIGEGLMALMAWMAPLLGIGGLIWLAFWQRRRRQTAFGPAAAEAA